MDDTQIWAIISIGAASFLGFMAFVGAGVHANNKAIREIALGQQRHDFQFEKIAERFEGVDQRFDGIETEMRAMGELLADRIYGLGKKLDDHLRWHAS